MRQGRDWLKTRTLAGIGQLLVRIGIHHKQEREYIHGPDPNGHAKVADVSDCLEHAGRAPCRNG